MMTSYAQTLYIDATTVEIGMLLHAVNRKLIVMVAQWDCMNEGNLYNKTSTVYRHRASITVLDISR
jgi:hypothetical protein